jgi:hypothetical protein
VAPRHEPRGQVILEHQQSGSNLLTRNLGAQNRLAADQMQPHDHQHKRNHRWQIGAGYSYGSLCHG